MDSLKYLELCTCPLLKDNSLCELIKNCENLEILLLERCLLVTNVLLDAAEKATKERKNNVSLYLTTFNTGMRVDNFKNTSPLLKIFKNVKRVKGAESFTDSFFPDVRNFEFVDFWICYILQCE